MEENINILMLGWELPPYHSGGLGRACEGMTKGLARSGVGVNFVLPKTFSDVHYDWMQVYDASAFALNPRKNGVFDEEICLTYVKRRQCALTHGYITQAITETMCYDCLRAQTTDVIDTEELSHVDFYAKGVLEIAKRHDFQAIHAHDWMTFPAAIAARKAAALRGRKVPFIAHVHATEIDRHDGQRIYQVERHGMHAADRIIAVSNYTKNIICEHYGVDPAKVSVVHNGIEPRFIKLYPNHALKRRYKLVLFIGRITYQKGPDYYVQVAKRVTDQYSNVKFLMVGSGDMQAAMVEMAARDGLTGKLLFSPWIGDGMMDAAYQMADVFVMPSVSEPFGIVPLEAIQNGTPVVVSRKSGFVEVVKNCVAVDFWDIEKMSKAIVTLLKHEPYAKAMVRRAQEEVRGLTWDLAAGKLVSVYNETVEEVVYA